MVAMLLRLHSVKIHTQETVVQVPPAEPADPAVLPEPAAPVD